MASATGANTTPLGRLNPAMNTTKLMAATSGGGSSLLKPSYLGSGMPPPTMGGGMGQLQLAPPPQLGGQQHHPPIKREREPDLMDDYGMMPAMPVNRSANWPSDADSSWGQSADNTPPSDGKKRKRRSRWGNDDKEKVFIPGMPTVLPNNLSPDQEKAYLLQLQIEEISRRLRTGDLGIPLNPEERSPSPEPIYNSEGKRLNTREYRTRKKLDDDRHYMIQEMFKVNPEYKPPADYKPPMIRVCEKVMIPQDEHPDINFVGLLIGPRGNTLKSMEKDTGAKIIIRGKGSVKEGKVGRKDGQPLPGEDEPLHAFVTATNPDAVKRAVDRIRDIIRQGVEVPEGQNDLRRMQLRELALLNGTLREIEGPRCTNCGATNHRSWQCPDKPNVTNNVICTNCGGAGHISRDCREKKEGGAGGEGGGMFTAGGMDKSKIDEEYMSLMAELGEGPPPPTKSEMGGGGYGGGGGHILGGHNSGPPRAIMGPPGGGQWNNMGGQQKPQQMMNAVPPPNQGMHMMGGPAGVPPPPPGTGVGGQQMHPGMQGMSPQMQHAMQQQGMMMPWQQQGGPMGGGQMMGGMGGVPPPPGVQMAPQQGQQQQWMGGMQMQNPWQQQMAQPMQGGFPWMGYMGMNPAPPNGQILPPGIGGAPPPPPPLPANNQVDLSVLAGGLPNLLAAPPPPPPPS